MDKDTEIMIDVVDKLNEVYGNVTMEKEGLGFCLVYHPYYQWIGFTSEIQLWCSENDEREIDDETGEYTESLYDYCSNAYERLLKTVLNGEKNVQI